MIPPKLKRGDEIRVISPARSLAILSKEVRYNALIVLKNLGLTVTYSKNVSEKDEFILSSYGESNVALE